MQLGQIVLVSPKPGNVEGAGFRHWTHTALIYEQWAFLVLQKNPYSLHPGYTEHSRPFILKVLNFGGVVHSSSLSEFQRPVQGFQPFGTLYQYAW
jgi:hypothetical protein